MGLSLELAALYRRDLTRLRQQLDAFPEEVLWKTLPGVSNSAGHLVLHLEGNLREYVGRQLGSIAYQRKRDLEFTSRAIPLEELRRRIEAVLEMVPRIVATLTAPELEADYPENVFGAPISTGQFLVSLHGHLNYHLGQIDYLRRILTQGAAVEYAGL